MKVGPVYPDPLQLDRPSIDEPDASTYWHATAGPPPAHDGPLEGDLDCDVAIIGGGYSGLSCAYHLARSGAGKVVVLEANRPGWGCSGRNGSFARPAIGRVPYADWEKRWGGETARVLFREALDALETVRSSISQAGIDCDVQPDGWLKLAHRPERVAALKAEQRLLKERFGFEAEFLDTGRLEDEHFRGGEAHAALRWPLSFALHPLKLAYGLQRAAAEQGAAIHGGTAALGLQKDGDRHVVLTTGGLVRAREVVICSNGYSVERLFPMLRGRLLPVMSNIVVTRPLSAEEIESGNFRTTDCMSDTRTLLHYFRRLPDNRILMGGKGPVRPGSHNMAAHREELLRVVKRKFPFVETPEADYFWGGWVALTPDSIPHIATAEDDATLHYALGYIGSGVSCSIHAGRRIAKRIVGTGADLPAPLAMPLPRYPFAAFRRLGQRAVMRWHAFRDDGWRS